MKATRVEPRAGRPVRCYRVVPCGDIRVMDDQGREVAPVEQGGLRIGGPSVVPGYWRNPEADAASFAGGYWKVVVALFNVARALPPPERAR